MRRAGDQAGCQRPGFVAVERKRLKERELDGSDLSGHTFGRIKAFGCLRGYLRGKSFQEKELGQKWVASRDFDGIQIP
jgi:hypothetical protein